MVSPIFTSRTSRMLAITYPTSPASSRSRGWRLGVKTPTSATSRVTPACIMRIFSPARSSPSTTRTYAMIPR